MTLKNRALIGVLWLTFGGSAVAVADTMPVLKIGDITSTPGGSGDFLVSLKIPSASDLNLSAYQIKITTDVVGLQFKGVQRASSSYVFPKATGAISSDFGPPFSPPVTTFTALDFSSALSGYDTLVAGNTYDVLDVRYAIDSSAPLTTTGTVSFVSPGTGGSDLTQLTGAPPNYATIAFSATNGKVTISAVPEPSSLTLMVTSLLVAVGVVLRRRGVSGA